MTQLVPSGRADDRDLAALHARVADLEAALAGRDRERLQLRAELDAFTARYRREVGTLYEQLEELEHEIAEAELSELAADAPAARRPGAKRQFSGAAVPGSHAAPRFTSDATRKLFRDVAKAIHPDLARDEAARTRRHALMIEANQAYADGDEARLRVILRAWEQSPEAVPGSDRAALRLRLVRRIAQVEELLAAHELELEALRTSAVWQLKAKVDEAAAKGRDLVAEMIARLRRDIMVATNRRDAMRPRT